MIVYGGAILPGVAGIVSAAKTGSGLVYGLAFQEREFCRVASPKGRERYGTLSSPRIASINNQKAVLKVGSDEFFVTNVSSTTTTSGTGNVTTPSITLQPFFQELL